jgi:cytoskeletal protein CcmA (bactofilin family)
MAKYNEIETNTINLLGAGTEIVGNITSGSDIRIDGSLSGNLKTKGKVVIGETGSVLGEIHCKNADVDGSIEGKIVVAELLSLKAPSNIKGDIKAKKLAIEPGAKFTGNCNMSIDTPQINAAPKEPEKEASEPAKSK